MDGLRFLSKGEQFAAFLRAELARGRWEGLMPGRPELAAEFGVNKKTVDDAVHLLEREGILRSQGVGRRRLIENPAGGGSPRSLRIRILLYEKGDRSLPDQLELRHRLQVAGHDVSFASDSLCELGMDLARVARLVKREAADAWIVSAATREILQWFAAQGLRVFAQFGSFAELGIAGMGVHKIPAMREAVSRLLALGHRRIVLLTREERRKPVLRLFERAFLETLEGHGIATGPYHLPDWSGGPEGFQQCLDRLCQLTPPTAMIVGEAPLFLAAKLHLARIGLPAPERISLICDDPDPAFAWCLPRVSHLRWDSRPIVSRIVRWAAKLAAGEDDRGQGYTLAKWVEGETIGPPPG